MFGLMTMGKRSPAAAPVACDAWLMARAFGYGSPSRCRSASWCALEISVSHAS
jgi:hypothetical protein